MSLRRHTRVIAALLVGLLATSSTVSAYSAPPLVPTPASPAGLGATGTGGILDPIVPPASLVQLTDHARRIDVWRALLQQAESNITPNGDPGNYGGKQGSVAVTAYPEPNTYAYRNYCGPGASRVVISNWTSAVPSIDTVAAQEGTNPNWGTYLSTMVGPINNDAGTGGFYINQVAGTQGAFSNWVGADISGAHHPLITALRTQGNGYTLNGWSLSAAHIVAVYGFNFVTPGAGYVSYVETGGTMAGTAATGRNTYSYNPFWSLVTLNNGQIW